MALIPVTIFRLGADELDELEPLWSALREHHGRVAPQLGPTRDRGESWAVRRRLYEEWLADDRSFALIARTNIEALAYAMVVSREHRAATWPGDRYGELETLAVMPSARGAGVGSQLITQARAGLAAQGIDHMTITVVSSNEGALRFYRRHGFEPFINVIRGTTAPRD